MVTLCWRGCFITLLLVASTTRAIPIASSSSTLTESTADIEINFHRLAQHVSNHLLFDHVDPLVYQLSQYIASVLRSSMTLEKRPFLHDNSNNNNDHPNQMMMIKPAEEEHMDHDTIPVDMELLLGQLQGAVGSFLEDKLPGIWNRQLAGLDRTTLQAKLERHLTSHCPDQHYYSCMQQSRTTADNRNNDKDNSNNILLQQTIQIGDQTIQQDLTQAWLSILQNDLPYLFNAAKTQVTGVLHLFNPVEHQDYQVQWNMDWQDMRILFLDTWVTLSSKLPCHPSDHPTNLHWLNDSKQS